MCNVKTTNWFCTTVPALLLAIDYGSWYFKCGKAIQCYALAT